MKSDTKKLKLAISGAASTGKTTITKEISIRYNLRLVDELVDEQLDKYHINSLRDLPIKTQIIIQRELFETKRLLELDCPNFVSDRSLADYFIFWLNRCMPFVNEKETSDLLNKLKRTYKLVRSYFFY